MVEGLCSMCSLEIQLSTFVNLDVEIVFILFVRFVYVCLEVACFSIMFMCWNYIEPIWYGMYYVNVGRRVLSIVYASVVPLCCELVC